VIRFATQALVGALGIVVTALMIAAYTESIAMGVASAVAFGVFAVAADVVFEIRRWRAGGRLRIARQLRAPRQLPLPPAYVRR